jgi:hypothetical protein
VVNIKIALGETGLVGMYWINLAEDRDNCRVIVNVVINLQVPQNVWKFLSSCTTGGISRRLSSMELVT